MKQDIEFSIVFIFLLALVVPNPANAKIFYLDNAQGIVNGSTTYNPETRTNTGGKSLVYTSPWDAGNALVDGDTLYVREGEYYDVVPGSGTNKKWWLGSITINANNCLIGNYNNEVAWIKGGSSRYTPQYHHNNAVFLGGNNNIIAGIHIYGGLIFSGTSNMLKYCDLSGGWDHQGAWMVNDAGWPNCIRFVDSNNALVQNCKIHDNIMQRGICWNMAIIMHERDNNTIVENCDIYNTAAYFAFLKYQNGSRKHLFTGTGTQATYRYNLFRGANGGFALAAEPPNAPNPIQKQIFYQNIWINSGAVFHNMGYNKNLAAWIFNNTFYNPKIGALWNWLSYTCYNYFNNIVYWDKSNSSYNQYWESNPPDPFSNYIDFNNYYSPNGRMAPWRHGRFSTIKMSSWVSYTKNTLDVHSITTNPDFLNNSGQFMESTDFKRSSYPKNGRGEPFSAIMGAYSTGNEIIGIKK